MTAKLRLPDDTPAEKPEHKPISDHIPCMEGKLIPGSAACGQFDSKLHCLVEAVTEKLEYIQGHFIVKRIVRRRFAGSCCERLLPSPIARQAVRASSRGSPD